MIRISDFSLRNNRGQTILDKELLNWRHFYPQDENAIFGPVVRYTWAVGSKLFHKTDAENKIFLQQLPDGSGFLCFESDWVPNNCLLLDIYGEKRTRLTVPWQLTRPMNPESNQPPTSFARISTPAINPATGLQGEFGLSAWVEHAGTYYFEFDYHSAEFLWGREIRD